MTTDVDKKLWTLSSTLVDSVRIMVRLPIVFMSPLFLTAQQMEAVQSAVSSVNKSNISNVYHKQMGRIARMDGVLPGIQTFFEYGKSFALSDGSGSNMWGLYDEIATSTGSMAARSAESLAYLQLWQDLIGNTIGAFFRGTLKGKRREEQNILFELFFTLYYISLYVLMAFGSVVLRVLPSSYLLYKVVVLVQALLATSFVVPLAIVGLVALPFFIFTGATVQPLPSRQGYTAVPADTSTEISPIELFSVVLSKPSVDTKVGIRFGSNTSGRIMVTNIRPESIASDSDLQIGDIVYSINGKSLVSSTPREAAATLLAATGDVTLEASHDETSFGNEEATV
jgi:Periplasmic protease